MQRRLASQEPGTLCNFLFSEAYEPIHPPNTISTNLPIDKQYVFYNII